jgi:hypothetical protein
LTVTRQTNWRALNAVLHRLSEGEVKAMLDAEVAGPRRVTFVERLHQRYCALRAARERMELLKEVTK